MGFGSDSAVSAESDTLPDDFQPPIFLDRTNDQDFRHQYKGGWEHFVGGGVAAFNCNNDGFTDLYVAGGENKSKLLVNSGKSNVHFVHKADNSTDLTAVTGAYPIDIDSDGITDLAVLRAGENVLLRGLGNCQFENANQRWNFTSEDRWTTAFSATWEQGHNSPTLVFGNYVDRKREGGPFGACDSHMLYRMSDNADRQAGNHTDHKTTPSAFTQPIALSPGFCTLSMLFSDWQRNGKADLRVSNDRHYYLHDGHEQLWNMAPQPKLYQEEDGWQRFKIWGMGIASRDITGDGLPDYLLTSMSDQKFQTLKTNATGPEYIDQAFDRGMIAHRPYTTDSDEGRPSTAWHAQFGDVNNDGYDDLFIAKGNVDQMPDAAIKDPNNLLMQMQNGRFTEYGHSADIADTARSRGGALEDFNNDGLLDLVVVNRRADLRIYQNVTFQNKKSTNNHWLKVKVAQTGENRDAIGAWITIKQQTKNAEQTVSREITIGGGHASGSLVTQHFGFGKGLGKNDHAVKVQIRWPDQTNSKWYTLSLDKTWHIVRGQSPQVQ